MKLKSNSTIVKHIKLKIPSIELPINNSTLGTIKKYLTNSPPFLGNETYLMFGGEFHSRVLEHKSKFKVSKEQDSLIKKMSKSLEKNELYKKAISGKPKIETLLYNEVHGVPMRGTLDILNGNTAYDIKTTSETTEKAFIKKAIKLDYLRQSFVYKQLAGVDNFIFIGVSKKEPYNIFILNTKDYEKQEKQKSKEAYFLLQIAKEVSNYRGL